jgi:4-amino-4-deoxy-L-arabinose transferase-like glycosyltransferase
MAVGLAKTRLETEPRVVGGLIGASAALKLLLALATLDLPLNTDQEIFRMFSTRMADGRLSSPTLEALSGINDYSIWTSRALPVHVAVRWLAGAGDLPWMRLLNVAVSTATLAVVYLFACRLLPAGRRKWAVFLMLALPIQWYVTTDYSHHLYSSFYLLLGTWCAWELAHARQGLAGRVGLALLAAVCLLGMMLQRGIHLIALGAWAGMWFWTVITGRRWRSAAALAFWLGLVPVGLALPVARQVETWLERHDRHHLTSMLPAFAARGWCPESGGEYCGRYEQIDRATPLEERGGAMWRLVFSQIRRNPGVVCLRFPVIKTAKLFLVGYASNFEESLAQQNSPALAWARGLRLAAAPLFLALAGWGCFLLARRPLAEQGRWLPVCLVSVLTWGIYVFLGETSPRYSIFCQAGLALLGALAWPGGGQEPASSPGAVRELARRAVWVLALLAGLLAALTGVVMRQPEHRFYADLERGWRFPADEDPAAAVKTGSHRPFEAWIRLPADRAANQAVWQLPEPAAAGRTVAFYLLAADPAVQEALFTLSAGSQTLYRLPLAELLRPRQVRLNLPAATAHLVLRLERNEPATSSGAGGLLLGYLTCTDGPRRD